MYKLIFLTIVLNLQSQSFKQKVETYITDMYSKPISSSYSYIQLSKFNISEIEKSAHQLFFRDKLHCWKVMLADSTNRYIILENVIGKVQPITFIVIYNSEMEIELVDVLKYREAYGYEIKMKSFLNEFVQIGNNKQISDILKIRNISGATISVNAMRRGVYKLSQLMPKLKKELDAL